MNIVDAFDLWQSYGAEVRLAILDTIALFTAATDFLAQSLRHRDLIFWVSAAGSGQAYVWTNNASVEASFWSSGQPASLDDCVVLDRPFSMTFTRDMLLRTEPCDDERAFALCQVSSSAGTGN